MDNRADACGYRCSSGDDLGLARDLSDHADGGFSGLGLPGGRQG
jgi:hypothetical protein